jgi:hypothetical protein
MLMAHGMSVPTADFAAERAQDLVTSPGPIQPFSTPIVSTRRPTHSFLTNPSVLGSPIRTTSVSWSVPSFGLSVLAQINSHSGVVQGTSEQAAEDIAALFAILSASFSQFRGRPLHLAGESYAVRPHRPFMQSGRAEMRRRANSFHSSGPPYTTRTSASARSAWSRSTFAQSSSGTR